MLDTIVKHGLSAHSAAVVLAKDDRGTMKLGLAITEERVYPLRGSECDGNCGFLLEIQKISLAFSGGVN